MPNYDGEVYTSSFSTTEIRHHFVKKVYLILFGQLAFTFLCILISMLVPEINAFWREYFWIGLIFFVTALFLYTGMICCCPGVSRCYPLNYILLGTLTLLFTLALATFCSFYHLTWVLLAICITMLVCVAVTIFAIQTKWDITGWCIYIMIAIFVLILYGVIVSIISIFYKHIPVLDIIYSAILTLILLVVLMMDTQMIVGGRKYEICPEEYIFAALILYIDIILLFTLILGFFRH